MSAKKTTKKPVSKKVMAMHEQLQRQRGVRDLAKRFLIVCEDNKSARRYFETLRDHFNLSATSIIPVGSGGRTQPIQVVQKAVELKSNSENPESGTEPFDHVWCVIDGDYGKKIQNARSKAKANGVKLAISTQCFEYWVLLHFEQHDRSSNNCDEVVALLKHSHLPRYKKGDCDFREIVKNVYSACERAKRLRKQGIDRNELPESQNPCSEIYLLIEAILQEDS